MPITDFEKFQLKVCIADYKVGHYRFFKERLSTVLRSMACNKTVPYGVEIAGSPNVRNAYLTACMTACLHNRRLFSCLPALLLATLCLHTRPPEYLYFFIYNRCCRSGMLIPDPGFRIPDPKTSKTERNEKISCHTFFVATSFTKLFYFLNAEEKIWANFQRIK
jgi:hypothetical protein